MTATQPTTPAFTPAELSARALALIAEHNVPPNLENYGIWYRYAEGENHELTTEVEAIIKNKVPFSAHTSNYLFKQFVLSDRNTQIVNQAAIDANKLLGDVLRSVSTFGEETKDYSEGVGSYMDKLDELGEGDVQALVKELVAASTEVKQRGDELNERLEKSKAEVDFLKKNLEQVTSEAERDFLTGTYNRKAYDRLLEENLADAKSETKELTLLMIDIDHFKKFNDTFGHLLGDEVLKIVAKSLTDSVRGRDVVARYGGEEFSVVLPDTPLHGGMKVAESIRQAIAARELKRRDSGESYGQITVSIGVARFRPESDGPETLIARADSAMYQSKDKGRNRVTAEG